ncbi:MAG: hypothetical protein ACK41D_09185 [Rubricoccaceae bacterium]
MRVLALACSAFLLAGCTDTSEPNTAAVPADPAAPAAAPGTATEPYEDDLLSVAADWTCDENARFDQISMNVAEGANEYMAYVRLGADGSLSVADAGTWEYDGRSLTLTSGSGEVTRYAPAEVIDAATLRLTRADNGDVVTCQIDPISP